MTEKELNKLFAEKLKGQSFPFDQKAWESMEQMLDPQEPLSEVEYRKLFNDKLSAANFAFNPANWSEMETTLNEEQGAMSQDEVKKLFKTKLQSQSFEFNPANWERMEAILDSGSNKGFFYYWRSAAAILLFAAATIAFQFNDAGSTFKRNGLERISSSPQEIGVQPKTIIPQESQSPKLKSSEPNSPKDAAPNLEQGIGVIPPAAPVNNSIAASQQPSNKSNKASSLPPQVVSTFSNEPASILADNAGLDYRTWKDFPSISSSLGYIEPLELEEIAKPAPTKALYVPVAYSKISLLAGPSVNPAYNGSTGAGFFAGLEYEYGFSERLSLSAGLNFNFGGDMGIETLSDSTFFGLARTDVLTHNHYKNMSSLRVPLSLNIKLSPKHSFSIGAYADALMAVSMYKEKTTTIFKQDPVVEKTSGNAPQNSFSSFSGGANFAYTYQYSDRLSIGLSQHYGFVDLTNDQHQNFEKHHQTSQTNLVLKFSIWER